MIRIKPRQAILILIVAIVIVFGRTLWAGFVGWDDDIHIIRNAHLQPVTLDQIAWFWRHQYLNLYVPMSYTVFSVLTAIAEAYRAPVIRGDMHTPDAHPFHIANLLLHCANAVLVYLLLRALTKRGNASLIGALLFALHPLQVESVAWVSELRGLLSGFFSLASLYAYVRFVRVTRVGDPKQRAWEPYAASFFSLALAMLSKPSAAALPVVFVIIDVLRFKRPLRVAVAPALLFLVIVVPLVLKTQHVQPVPEWIKVPFWKAPMVAWDALAFYVMKLVLPIGLATDYGRSPDKILATAQPYIDWILPVAVAALAWQLRRRLPLVGAGALIALAFLLPVLGLTPFVYQAFSTVADRYCYMAMFGVALAVATVLARFPNRRAFGAASAVVAVCGVLSLVQAGYWNNTISLMTHTVAVNPTSGISYQDLGDAYLEAGNLTQGVASLEKAVQYRTGDYKPYFFIGSTLIQLGRYQEAAPYLRTALDLHPDLPNAAYNMGQIDRQLGMPEDALAWYEKAISLDPPRSDARVNMALIYIQAKRYDQAAAIANDGLLYRPESASLHEILGLALDREGKPEAAEGALGAAVALAPGNIQARLMHGITLMQIGRKGQGSSELAKARQAMGSYSAFQEALQSASTDLGLRIKSKGAH